MPAPSFHSATAVPVGYPGLKAMSDHIIHRVFLGLVAVDVMLLAALAILQHSLTDRLSPVLINFSLLAVTCWAYARLYRKIHAH